MGQHSLMLAEREQIYLMKKSSKSLQEIADEKQISYACARKWWRRCRDEGLAGLQFRKRGRKPIGLLSSFNVAIVEKSLEIKRSHPRWGANRVLLELSGIPELAGLSLPSRSRLQAFFKQACPECIALWTKHKRVPQPSMKSGNWIIKKVIILKMVKLPLCVVFVIPLEQLVLLAEHFQSKQHADGENSPGRKSGKSCALPLQNGALYLIVS